MSKVFGQPMFFVLKPPYGMIPGETEVSARLTIRYSVFNWGVHQWSAFAVVGLIIAFCQFRKGKPGLVSTVLQPATRRLPGSRWLGSAVDVFAAVATV